jgi:hypothetical protein
VFTLGMYSAPGSGGYRTGSMTWWWESQAPSGIRGSLGIQDAVALYVTLFNQIAARIRPSHRGSEGTSDK